METTIRVKTETKDRLVKYGSYGDSHDDILNKVLDLAEENKK